MTDVSLNLDGVERETLEVDVLLVGAGPANLACAIRLQQLFAEKGYAGTSIREICAKAEASVPMVHHYFGNKAGLMQAILGQLSGERFDVPVRIIGGELHSREEFLVKLELFVSETFATLLALAPVFRIVAREGSEFADMNRVHSALAEFLTRAQEKGYLRASLRPEFTTGLILDRLGNQIMFAGNPKYSGPSVLLDEEYRQDWLKANIDALLFGLAGE